MNSKIPCGGFYLSNTLGVDENGKLGVNGGEPYKSLVTDGEGGVKWEDRLAYVSTEYQEIFSQENIEFTENSGRYLSPNIDIAAINVGEKYRVDFDGNAYVSTAFTSITGAPMIGIGNGALAGGEDDTGEPFLIIYYTLGQTIQIGTTLPGSSHNVSIYASVETTHKIPEKFLPDQPVFYYSENGKLVDAEGIEMTLEQAKAIGLNFIIQTDSSAARPISALYDDTGASFYVADVANGSSGTFVLRSVRVGIPLLG